MVSRNPDKLHRLSVTQRPCSDVVSITEYLFIFFSRNEKCQRKCTSLLYLSTILEDLYFTQVLLKINTRTLTRVKKHTFLLLTFSFFTYFDLKLLATNLKIYFSVAQLRSLFEICLKSNSRPCQMQLHEFDFENLCHQIERSMLREVIFKFGNFTELVLFGCYSHFNVHSLLKY